MTTCKTCGSPTYVDFRNRVTRCRGCDQVECRCAPVPVWLQRAKASRYGLAKDLSGAAA